MKITWDEPKRLRNLETHAMDFESIHGFEWASAILRPTHSGAQGGRRFKAIGFLEDDLITAVFSGLGSEAVSLISLRRASRAERLEYAEAQTYP